MKDILSLAEEEITLKRGDFLKVGGSVDTNTYFVISGSLKLFIENELGEEQIIRFGYINNIIGAIDSFITNQPSDFYIQAIKEAKVRVITKEKLKAFIASSEERKNEYIQLLEGLILQQMERENDLLIQSPQMRYEKVLSRSPQLFQEIPLRHIANYLRMTPETLSRLKNLDSNQG